MCVCVRAESAGAILPARTAAQMVRTKEAELVNTAKFSVWAFRTVLGVSACVCVCVCVCEREREREREEGVEGCVSACDRNKRYLLS